VAEPGRDDVNRDAGESSRRCAGDHAAGCG
jgi:hypothetical protein